MELDEIKSLFSKVFRTPYLWAVQSPRRSLLTLLAFLIIGVPCLQYLQDLARHVDYIKITIDILTLALKLSSQVKFLVSIFVIIFILLIYLLREDRMTKVLEDNFGSELNHWAIPLGSGWAIQICPDRLGRMLSVTQSSYPGILKDAYNWYDYQISFLAKIDPDVKERNQNFTFIIRSEDNYNGIMFQITKTHIHPHLLYIIQLSS